MHQRWVIFKKEFKDSLRDRRGLLTVGLVTVLAGPLCLLFMANMLSEYEAKSERRVVVVHRLADSPSLQNYLQRESAQIVPAPPDYEAALREGRLLEPVVIVPPQFDQQWQRGEVATLTLLTNSQQARTQASVSRLKRWLLGYASMQSEWALMQQPTLLRMHELIQLEEQDQASDKAQTVKLFGMLPYFLVFAALYGVWSAALETTAGEREKGTLEALAVTLTSPVHLVIGKWLAVTTLGAILATLATLGFIPAQAWIASDTLKAMFNFGSDEAMICLCLILPLVGFFAALLLFLGAVAASTRQAQTNATLVMLLVAFVPMLFLTQGGQVSVWQTCLPVLAQHHGIIALLSGEPLSLKPILSLVGCHAILILFFITITSRVFATIRHH
ncbi:ABC transporter permease [Methylophilus aquaticus]|uniref:ABC transporter permease n=1 Tax=Methylophilus aquaticus TaxID=1971610 RepID=A0ABT9JP54_9PROT|nr:ABC transporter permease [Methylophilus aquaticus]MDP8566360.1 ABC transporter permease [Methylophilus aquaticus]